MDQNNLIVRQFLGALVGVALQIMGFCKLEALEILSGD